MRLIGTGGMGEVYEVEDRVREQRVALKRLTGMEPVHLQLFKDEFRALADIRHPQLVRMLELFHEDSGWFFTMNLVDGVPLSRDAEDTSVSQGVTDPTAETVVAEPGSSSLVDTDALTVIAPADAPAIVHSWEELARIRRIFASLAKAVEALHRFGKLHCDIKPSNALVRADETVVLLDFGLVSDLGGASKEVTQKIVSGTLPFMSPEQIKGGQLTPASDWYAVGVMLFEVLTGRCPFGGNVTSVLKAKLAQPPKFKPEERLHLPTDLLELVSALLSNEPGVRPNPAEILGVLQGITPPPDGGEERSAQPVFVGRLSQLEHLDAALERVRSGAATTVQLSGISGMGKTALLDRFLDQAAEAPDAIVLRGRCRERESLAYKALDPVVDALTDVLVRMSELEAATLLPRYASSLARVFPVLKRITAVRTMVENTAAPASSRELRHQAFGALRELIAALADRHTLVISIDDLQWADADSIPLILKLIRPPDAPVILLLLSYRSEERDRSEILEALLNDEGFPSGDSLAVVDVGPLDEADSERMVHAVMGRSDDQVAARARLIARDAGGVPFFIETLARHAAEESTEVKGALTRETLDSLLVASLRKLPQKAQRMMFAIALIGRPVRVTHVAEISQTGRDWWGTLDALQWAHFVRSTAQDQDRLVEPYHDRVREAVSQGLSEASRRALHERILQVLGWAGRGTAEELVFHSLGAGMKADAAKHARTAGAEALRVMAFAKAAQFFELALELGQWEPEEQQPLREDLGQALGFAGRSRDAADRYLEAAENAPEDHRRRLRICAAEQLLWGGYVDRAKEVLGEALQEVGVGLPRTGVGALLRFLALRLLLRLRGMGFTERTLGDLPPREVAMVDLFMSVGAGLGMVDPLNGSLFRVRALLGSLRLGELYRVARSLCVEATYRAAFGGRGYQVAADLLERAASFFERLDSDPGRVTHALGTGMSMFQQGRWSECLDAMTRGRDIGIARCSGMAFELNTIEFFRCHALIWLGRLSEARRGFDVLVADARERGDLHTVAHTVGAAMVPLGILDNDVERAQAELDEVRASLPRGEADLFAAYAFRGLAITALYAGDIPEAVRWSDRLSALLRNPVVGGVKIIRIYASEIRAGVSLLAASKGTQELSTVKRRVRKEARYLRTYGLAWPDAIAAFLDAQLAVLGGDPATSAEAFRGAEGRYHAIGMELHAVAARCCRLSLSPDRRDEVEASYESLRTTGVAAPRRLVAMLAPVVFAKPDPDC